MRGALRSPCAVRLGPHVLTFGLLSTAVLLFHSTNLGQLVLATLGLPSKPNPLEPPAPGTDHAQLQAILLQVHRDPAIPARTLPSSAESAASSAQQLAPVLGKSSPTLTTPSLKAAEVPRSPAALEPPVATTTVSEVLIDGAMGMPQTPSADSGGGAFGSGLRAAIVVVGLVRHLFEPELVDPYPYTGQRLSTDALGSAHYLTESLMADFGRSGVDLFMCCDAGHADKLRETEWGNLRPSAVWEYTTEMRGQKAQWERFRHCFRQLESHCATSGGVAGTYRWVVRTRFDTVFFAPAPPISSLRPQAAVHAPARKIGGRSPENYPADLGLETDDVWSYAGEPCSNRNRCAKRGGGGSDNTSSCLLLTDQFAYIPGAWTKTYFTSVGPESRPPPPPPTATKYALIEGHHNCEWPEGRITCGLMDNGVALRIMRLHARIARRVGSIRRLPEGESCKAGGK
eukprot:SAG31_NODE_1081_length_10014_cov_16.919617_6_plen_457_part_00